MQYNDIEIIFMQELVKEDFQYMTGYAQQSNMGTQVRRTVTLPRYTIEWTAIEKCQWQGHGGMMRADAACKLVRSIGMCKEVGKRTILQYRGQLLAAPLAPQLYDRRRLYLVMTAQETTTPFSFRSLKDNLDLIDV